MKTLMREAAGYFVASAVALVADFAILWLLVNEFSWEYLLAATASFSAGAVVAYAICVRLVFTQHRLRDRRAEFVSFVAIGAAGAGVNVGVIYGCVHFLGTDVMIAKAVAAGFTFVCNFILRRQLLFVKKPLRHETSAYVQH
jgi:putative flippase GtrA